MYRTIRLYGSKIINIVRLSSFLRIRTLCVLFIQLIRDFFYFHFKECCFFENQKIDSIRRWMDEHLLRYGSCNISIATRKVK